MRCKSARQRMALLVGGDLPGDQQLKLAAHVQGCARCHDRLRQLRRERAAVDLLVAADGPPPLPGDFSRQLERRIAEGKTYKPRFSFRWRWLPVGAGAGLAALALVYFALGGGPVERPQVAPLAAGAGHGVEIRWNRPWLAAVEGPHRLDDWRSGGGPGVYAIMHRPDPEAKPDTYVIDYCGENDGALGRDNPWLRHLARRISAAGGGDREVYVALYPMPNSSRRQRQRVHGWLVKRWQPLFN